MRKDDLVRLRHMLDAAKEAIGFVQNRTRSALEGDRMLVLSIVKSIEILGEAATRVTKECHNEFPQIPWRNIIAMRNRLIHAYFDIDLDRVWDTVTDDLPPLVQELERILGSAENQPSLA
ncbi:MAG: DUF86 domain-containing protein [Desulfobacterales bacterium]|nr:DUF86 domain-containing protein [Desulfobacterales bacterium]